MIRRIAIVLIALTTPFLSGCYYFATPDGHTVVFHSNYEPATGKGGVVDVFHRGDHYRLDLLVDEGPLYEDGSVSHETDPCMVPELGCE